MMLPRTTMCNLEMFYKGFGEIKENFHDGLIITGAPVEMLEFKEISYWNEITQIFDWARKTRYLNALYLLCSGIVAYYAAEYPASPLNP